LTRTTLVYTCSHADPDVSNERFDWLGEFIYDLRPDMVVDLGDGADMRSLNSYDTRYPQKVVSQSYEADIESYNDGPAIASYDGVYYSHFISSGAYGTAMSGQHHANALLGKLASSITVGHSHKFDYKYKGDACPAPIHGLVAGCYKGKKDNNEWRHGVAVKNYLSNGDYDLTWVSLDRLEKEYGN